MLGKAFRLLNRWMVVLWRLGLGRWADVWPTMSGRILVLEHQGRTSGATYRTPLNFTPADDAVHCVAAFGSRSDWYRNVMAMDDAIVWLPDGRWRARPTDVSDAPDRLDTIRRVLIDSGFAAPAFGMHPRLMTDAELAEASSQYRLVRFDLIGRIEPGPADLAWVWPVTAAVALGTGLVGWAIGCRSKR